jgi:20S proteasome alpha/beta subunit
MFNYTKQLKWGKLIPKLPNMTFILGARCSDGVVLVADRKITNLDEGLTFEYGDKLFAELSHIVFGSSGSTGIFELFRAKIRNHIRTQTVNVENIIPILSNYVYELNSHYKFRQELIFDVLVTIGYKDKKSILTYINAYGLPSEVKTGQSIGTGRKYVKSFIDRVWNDNITMKEVAEIGYFIIKYIEKFKLDESVGIGEFHPLIWYIPDYYEENESGEVIKNKDVQAKRGRFSYNGKKNFQDS